MKSVGKELKAGGDSGSQLLVIAAVVGLGAVIIGGAQWTHPNAGASQGAARTEAAAPAAQTAFEYFPAQYVNQGKEIGEHIQAF